ncbi:MAG: hypothetical protein ACK4SU_01025 [Dictyoglomus sp.]
MDNTKKDISQMFVDNFETPNKGARKQRNLSNLLRLIRNPDSIVLVRPPRKTLYYVRELNRLSSQSINALLNKKVSAEDIKKFRAEIRELALTAWEKLSSIYTFANENKLEEWRNFNETYEQKESLVRQNSSTGIYVAIPISEELGMLFTAVKHMCLIRKRLRWDINIQVAEVLSDVADMIVERGKILEEEFKKKLQV